jgi:DNA-binding transcriptional MerR regulator
MLIGELVKQTGFSKDTIRFYEKQGLIQINQKERRRNNYKEYSRDTVERLHAIKRLKNLGFTLNEVAELLDRMDVNEATCDQVSHKIRSKVEWFDQKIRELIQIRSMLLEGVIKCEGYCNPKEKDENCPLLTGH